MSQCCSPHPHKSVQLGWHLPGAVAFSYLFRLDGKSMVTQLARDADAYVIGPGRAADRQTALDFGAQEFVDLENDSLDDVGGVDVVFDVIGRDIGKRSAGLIRARGTALSVVRAAGGAAR